MVNCSSPPLFKQSSPLYCFFVPPPPHLKVGFFSEHPKYSFSSLIPSYLLKTTKFSGKISQFELLVMTEKNIFAYKLFFSLNISDFNLFFMWQFQTLSLFPSSTALKVEVLSSPLFWKFGWRLNLPLQKGWGATTSRLYRTTYDETVYLYSGTH